MPIRINLLAEEQAAEEMRRRDPAKRAVWFAAFLVMLVLAWSSTLQLKLMTDKAALSKLEAQRSSQTNEYNLVLKNQKKLTEINDKLIALHRLATNRFLQAEMLNALQHTSVEGVQLMRLRCDQGFTTVPEVKAKTVDGKLVLGKPGSSTEKIILTLDAKDVGPNPGNERINRFKALLAEQPYFQRVHVSTNEILLKNLSAPQVDNETGNSYVLFSLECRYPERLR